MRDPVRRVDPIEETCRFLKGCMESESWRADPDGFAYDCPAAIDEVEASNLPDWAKTWAIYALSRAAQTRKRKGKPTRRNRNEAIRSAAIKLVMRGYKPTRNDVTRDRDSASSIIHQALRRLGEKMSEKSINAIVAKVGADFIKEKVSPAFIEYLREHASELLYLFESDPNASEIVECLGDPSC